MSDTHTFTVEEGQRQMILQALAMMAVDRPGWDYAANEIAKLMDNVVDDKAQTYYMLKKYADLDMPIKLDWQPAEGGLIARVPAEDYQGKGFVAIYALKRPSYCDRGKWHVLVEPEGDIAGLDDQEGFPRYFFEIEHLQKEMQIWANWRNKCLKAIGLKRP